MVSSRSLGVWRAGTVALAALAVLLAGTTAWLWRRDRGAASSPAAAHPIRFALPPPPNVRFGSNIPNVETTNIAFAPDGTRLAFIATPSGQSARIFIRSLEAESARAVPGSEGAQAVFWSPDSRSLGFVAAGKLKRIDQAGGAAVTIWVTIDNPANVLSILETPASEMDLRFSPAGGRVAFVSDESGRPEVYVAPFPVTRARAIAVSSGGAAAPRWRRDGRELYFLSGHRLLVAAIKADGRPADPVPLFATDRWANFEVMDDGARFLAIVRESLAVEQPLTVLLNWRQVIGSTLR
jgi:Tol biopolymer transport system component